MKTAAFLIVVGCCAVLITTVSCTKTGFVGAVSHDMFGNWVQVKIPDGCVPRQIAASEGSAGVAVLCEDGRLFR